MVATARKPRKNESLAALDLPVSFGNISIGDKSARIGVHVERNALSLSKADKELCDMRLTGRIVAKPAGWSSDQAALPGMEEDEILAGVFDVKGFSVTSKNVSFGLTFNLKGIRVELLALFAKRQGRLTVEASEGIPEEEKGGGEADED